MRLAKHRPATRSGAAVVEMAVVAPVFIMLLLGLIESARLGMVAQLLTTASREGCRVAVVYGNALTDVQSRVNAVFSGSGITAPTVTATSSDPGTAGAWLTPSNWNSASGGTAITLVVRFKYSSVSWLPTPYFLKSANVSATATLSSEAP